MQFIYMPITTQWSYWKDMISLALWYLVQGTCSLFHFTEEETEGPREAHGWPEFRCFRSQASWVFSFHTPRLLPSGSSSLLRGLGQGWLLVEEASREAVTNGCLWGDLWCWLRGPERKTGEQGSLSLFRPVLGSLWLSSPFSLIVARVRTSEEIPF